ncbi:MAG: hypothetical protein JW772_03725 [Candidatus Diapherotrites archaeon]|nr:hypothetical protein [Candidatus Diapherotrites archaeon]
MEQAKELSTAINAAKEAGKILLNNLESESVIKVKDRQDVATNADLASEKEIIEIIESEFPGHNILSEESKPKEKGSEVTWIIDPLDGTKNYFRKIPLFTVSIALAKKKKLFWA